MNSEMQNLHCNVAVLQELAAALQNHLGLKRKAIFLWLLSVDRILLLELDVGQNNTLHVANNARVLLAAIEGFLYHTWKMTFPAARVTSSLKQHAGLALRAAGCAGLNRIYVLIASVLLELGDMSH